ncbi:MAG: M3 family metallopeptidase [Akkermansia sp.]|nr:M3 family metallopeptidase [Akkermansia sp.]
MTIRTLMLTALCALPGAVVVQAGETPPAAVAPAAEEHPYFADMPYPAWSKLTAAQALKDAPVAMQLAHARLEAIRSLKPEQMSFENTFVALGEATRELERVSDYLRTRASVMDAPDVRDAQAALMPELNTFYSAVMADTRLWETLRVAAEQPWVAQLSAQQKRLVQQTLDGFRANGAELAPDKKARKAEIEQELSQLTLQFSKNVLDSTNAWEYLVTDKTQLAGMSENWMSAAAAEAAALGHGTPEAPVWRISLKPGSAGTVLRDCSVEATRKLCWEAQITIGKGGKYDNAAIVHRVMLLRAELAQLLGFNTYADYKTRDRMVNSGAKAMGFVDNMMQRLEPAFRAECAELLAYANECRGEKSTTMAPWNLRYYLNEYTQKKCAFDPEAVRSYLAGEQVLNGMFDIYSKLYNINVSEMATVCLEPGQPCPVGRVEVWHPEVRMFAITDNATGAHLGSFYLDLYPRAGKRAGAWVSPLRAGAPGKNGAPHAPHLASITANLTRPVGDKPALFSHMDVQTIFHEFGHMLHSMLTDTELAAHWGAYISWDFIELPSIINENWTWAPEALALFARHYETGEPMPAQLVERLQKSRYFLPAIANMRQFCLSKLDLEMHMNYASRFAGRDLDAESAALLAPWQMPAGVDEPSYMRRLSHCMTGAYSAGYYSYQWADVLAADAYSRFEAEGILNPAPAAAFRKAVLSVGGSKPAIEAFRAFLGRDPDPDAFLKEIGVVK